MKKTIRIIGVSILLVVFVIIGVMAFYFYMFHLAFETGPGRDHYYFLDKNERYEMLELGGIYLFNSEISGMSITSSINKYIRKDGYVYIIENANFSTGGNENTTYYYDRDIETGEMIAYTDPSEIPLYIVLNYETGEATKYMSLDEMPEDIKTIFEEPVTEECLKDRSCYEETED